MPIIIQPKIRQLQKAMENNHLIQARNSVSDTQARAKESGGVKIVAPITFWILRGSKYTSPLSGA